ncbi:MAG: DUF4180 domain-containing protein [Chloroflexi bacterium]|nr:DUF4180 domain-containing protein [Chloroflexota bacterium]
MEQKIHEISGQNIVEIISDEIEISSVQESLDMMASVYYSEASGMVIYKRNLSPEFFELKSGLAGEILLKFSNYHMKLSIVGDFSNYKSSSLKAFIVECNRGKQFFFVADIEAALQKMTS